MGQHIGSAQTDNPIGPWAFCPWPSSGRRNQRLVNARRRPQAQATRIYGKVRRGTRSGGQRRK